MQGRLVVSRVSPGGPGRPGRHQGRRHHPRRRRRRRAHAGRVLPQGLGTRRRRRRHSAARPAGRRRQGRSRSIRSTASTTSARRRRTDAYQRRQRPVATPRAVRGPRRSAPVECAGLAPTLARRCAARSPRPPMLLYAATIFVSAFLLFLVQPIVGEADPAVVRRLGGRLDDVPRVLPDDTARGLRVLRSRRAPAAAARADPDCTRRSCSLSLARAADRARRALEADGHREPVVADSRPARRDDRTALLPAVDDEPAGAGVVRARASRHESVPAVRAVEPRVDAGARRLPVPARALGADAHAGARLVGRLCALRRAVRCGRPGRASSLRPRTAPRPTRGTAARRATLPATSRRPPPARQMLWATLAATASLLLLAVSNHITQNIAAVPLLWIAAARDLPAHVHPLLRRQGLVSARRSSWRCSRPASA